MQRSDTNNCRHAAVVSDSAGECGDDHSFLEKLREKENKRRQKKGKVVFIGNYTINIWF